MKITRIVKQVKNAGRYSVYVDDKYSFSLSESQLAVSGLHIGQDLTTEELAKLKGESEYGKLYERTLRWLAIRPRSEWEVNEYLKKITKKSPTAEAHTPQIAKNLQIGGWVDDEKFARSWVESRRLLRATSKKKLWVELRQKRVPQDIIDQVLADDETDEIEVLRDLIARKRRQSQYADQQKLMAYLARQGFRYDQIRQALDELAD